MAFDYEGQAKAKSEAERLEQAKAQLIGVGSVVDLGPVEDKAEVWANRQRRDQKWPDLSGTQDVQTSDYFQQAGISNSSLGNGLVYQWSTPKPRLIVLTVAQKSLPKESLATAIKIMEECGYKVTLLEFSPALGITPQVMVPPQ